MAVITRLSDEFIKAHGLNEDEQKLLLFFANGNPVSNRQLDQVRSDLVDKTLASIPAVRDIAKKLDLKPSAKVNARGFIKRLHHLFLNKVLEGDCTISIPEKKLQALETLSNESPRNLDRYFNICRQIALGASSKEIAEALRYKDERSLKVLISQQVRSKLSVESSGQAAILVRAFDVWKTQTIREDAERVGLDISPNHGGITDSQFAAVTLDLNGSL